MLDTADLYGLGEARQKNWPRDVQLLLAKTKQELRSFNNPLNETRKRAEEMFRCSGGVKGSGGD